MKIILCLNAGEKIVRLDVTEKWLTSELKRKCELLWRKPHNKMEIFRDGEVLDDYQTLKQCRIVENDFLCVLTPAEEDIRMPTNSNEEPTELLLMPPSSNPISVTSIANSNDLSVSEELQKITRDMLRQSNYKLSSALEKENLASYFGVLTEQMNHQTNVYKQLCEEQTNSFNADGTQENTQVDRVSDNIGVQMKMLVIACKVNSVPIKAVIASGAQTTVMSEKFAKHCKIEQLIDTKQCGLAKGTGRIHEIDLQIGKTLITVGITVVKELALNMVIGLDILRAYNCLIDLKRNIFKIGNSETEFLNENIIDAHND